MKKCIVITPQQSEEMLQKHIYLPAENSDLEYGATRFPSIPLLNAFVEDDEHIEIVAVTYDTPHCHRNLDLFQEEVAALCAGKGADYKIDSIEVPFDDSLQAVLNVYLQLISRVDDGDILLADITFGSKPMPIVLTMALQYAYRTKQDVAIECVVYGQIGHHTETKEAKIFDVTALVQLDEIVRLMANRNVEDPASIIEQIISG